MVHLPSSSSAEPTILILGAGVIGLTTSLVLRRAYPQAAISIVAKHFPGDRSIEYASPWAGANWCSMATDGGALEELDRVSFGVFGEMVRTGVGKVNGVEEGELRAVFDSPIEEAGVLSQGTNEIWYRDLCQLEDIPKDELPEGAAFGVDFKRTFRINTQVYLNWLQTQAIQSQISLTRRHYASLTTLLTDHPSTTTLINCTGLGSLHLSDIRDTSLYPTRGQTVLIAEPKTPIPRMYLRSPRRVDPTTTYVFPRPLGGGVILGGSRQDGDWSAEADERLAEGIMQKCCQLCPELGSVEELQVVSHNVGLRPSRKGGPRIEVQRWANGVPVVHAYGHSGAGYQASWGTAERVLELVKSTLESPSSKL